MKVLFINRMLSLVRGGGETFDLEIGRHLAKLGCEVSYLSGLPLFGNGRPPVIPESFRPPPAMHTVRSPWLAWIPWDRMRGGWRVWLLDRRLFEARALKWVLPRQADYDIVHLCEMPDWPARAKAAGLKSPVVVRLTGPEGAKDSPGLRAADGVIASGVSVEKVRRLVRPDCENIPNSVDTDLFRPQPSDFRRRLGVGPDTCLVLYVARFQDFKNHQMLVRAFAEFLKERPDARLILVGEGHLKSWIRKDCAEMGIADRVLFLGEIPFTDLPALYAAVDIKVISSDYESFSFATIEAMASGLPIATTDCAWVPVLIGDIPSAFPLPPSSLRVAPGGVISPIKDPGALAKGLLRLAGDPELRKKMGEWNRRKAVAEHGWASSASKLLALYRRLTGKES